MLEGERLTRKTHEMLKSKGYRFFSIKSVAIDKRSGRLSAMSLQATKEIPHFLHNSCMGIDDGMILGLIGIDEVQLTLIDHH